VALRSLVFPSWGDIVMKHYVVAAAEFVGYCVTWFFVGALVVAALRQGDPAGLVLALGFAAVVLGIAHGIDAGLTYHVAKKGLHSRRGPREADVLQDLQG
jgi:hypothetical protein